MNKTFYKKINKLLQDQFNVYQFETYLLKTWGGEKCVIDDDDIEEIADLLRESNAIYHGCSNCGAHVCKVCNNNEYRSDDDDSDVSYEEERILRVKCVGCKDEGEIDY